MQKQKNYQLAIIAVLAFAVLFMSVGFAAYAQRLTINGTTTVAGTKWSVHFKSNSYSELDGSVTGTTHALSDTSAEYSVTLDKPGDFYGFTVDMINDGNFDAVLNKISMSSLTAAQQKYLRYTITYDGQSYTTTTDGLSVALAKQGGVKTATVKIEYVLPENAADLPTDSVTLNLITHFDFVQAQ